MKQMRLEAPIEKGSKSKFSRKEKTSISTKDRRYLILFRVSTAVVEAITVGASFHALQW